jgi:hypothetical protein
LKIIRSVGHGVWAHSFCNCYSRIRSESKADAESESELESEAEAEAEVESGSESVFKKTLGNSAYNQKAKKES